MESKREHRYKLAKRLIEFGQYVTAAIIFNELGEYKDSEELLDNCKNAFSVLDERKYIKGVFNNEKRLSKRCKNKPNNAVSFVGENNRISTIQSDNNMNQTQLYQHEKKLFPIYSTEPISGGRCSKCKVPFVAMRVNSAVRNKENNLLGYRALKIWRCGKCNMMYPDSNSYKRIIKELSKKKSSNFSFSYRLKADTGAKNQEYKNLPISSFAFYITDNSLGSNSINDLSLNLSKSSFLKDAGYSTNKPDSLRQAILKEQILLRGKREVSDLLRLQINLHKNQKNERGELRYKVALMVWQSDMNYIDRL